MVQGNVTARTDPAPVVLGAPTAKLTQLEKMRGKAKKRRTFWESMWDEIFRYALPTRRRFEEGGNLSQDIGEQRTELIFDETAVVEAPRLASRLLNSIIPEEATAFRLVPGPALPNELRSVRLQRDLDEVTKAVHEMWRGSNLREESHEAFQDFEIGTGVMAIDPGPFPGDMVTEHISYEKVMLLPGPDGRPLAVIRDRKLEVGQISAIWPRAEISDTLKRKIATDKDQEVLVSDMTLRDVSAPYGTRFTRTVWCNECQSVLFETELNGLGSSPWLVFRAGKSSGEVWGRGPLLNVLPAIKTANLTIELLLQNAELAVGGIWTYDDDGVMNFDNVILEPGTFIPRAVGSTIEPLVTNGRFDLTQIILEDQRRNIRRGLFAEETRRDGKTPPSAFEVSQERASRFEDMGAFSARVGTEYMLALIQRSIYILKEQGVLAGMPEVDGRRIAVHYESPLLQSQAQRDINAFLQYKGALASVYGEAAALLGDPFEEMRHLARLHRIPAKLVPSEAKVAQVLQQSAEIAQSNPQIGNALLPGP